MSYCINPDCPEPANRSNEDQNKCCSCHSSLVFKGYRAVQTLKESDSSQIYEIRKRNIIRILKVTPKKEGNSRMANNPEREGEILERLNHPGIPKVEPDGYFTLKPDGSRKTLHCLIMEKFDGQNLEDWLNYNEGSNLSEEQLTSWFKQLVQILNYLHGQGYVHRDIKPANIILHSHDQLGLVDFGSARKLDHTFALDLSNDENATVTICGSEGYIPPEQKRGRPAQQSDFFALARTMVHLITGVNPTYLEDDLGNCNWKSNAPLLPEFIVSLLDDMMAYKPKDRPANTQIILQRLERSTSSLKLHRLLHLLKPTSAQARKLPIISLITTFVLVISLLVTLYQRVTTSVSPLSFTSPRLETSESPSVPMCNNRSCIGRDPKDNGCAPNGNKVVKTLTSVLVNHEQQPRKTFKVELRYSPLCNSTWVRSTSPAGSFHYLQDVSGKQYGRAEVKNDSSLPHQFSDMGPSDVPLKACVQQPKKKTTCTNYISLTSDTSKPQV